VEIKENKCFNLWCIPEANFEL